MSLSHRPPAPNVGRFTAVILFFIVLVCVSMIGATEYLKFNLDRAETLLAAPDAAFDSEQNDFDRLRRILGYGGFLGLAQSYVSHHDASGFAEMKSDIKSANDIIEHLPEKTSAETRHDLTAIVANFDNALQKLNAPASEGDFTAADLVPLYAALPILDARVSSIRAETRLAAQNQTQYWGMLLTLVCWGSLIIAAFCAAWTYLTLRDKHSAPMRALAQSIQNMARGDMRTAIWGIERQDMIGELARAVDIARYHFSHLPDLSLLSEQGPVRMRFEGGSRSLFEAMMKAISRDSENIREQTQTLTQAVQEQKESISQMSTKVEHVLQNILQHGQDGDQQIRQAISEMVGSAENLKNAHAHAADQLSRLVPHIQDRASGMAEIAHLTGKQVAQTLQSLTLSEINLKANADNARETLNRLSSTADDLGERLFGAINLLQASGKVLAETTESIKSHGPITPHGEVLAPAISAETLAPLAAHLEQITAQLNDLQNRTLEPFAPQANTTASPAPLPPPVTADDFQESQLAFQTAFAQIQNKLEILGSNIEQARQAAEKTDTSHSPDETQIQLAKLGETLSEHVQKKFDALAAEIANTTRVLMDHNHSSTAQISVAVTTLGDKIGTIAATLPNELRQNLVPDLLSLSTRIEGLNNSHQQAWGEILAPALTAIEQAIQQQTNEILTQTEATQTRTEQSLIGRLDPKLVAMTADIQILKVTAEATKSLAQANQDELAKPASFQMPTELKQQMSDHWYHIAAQIESSRANVDKIFNTHIAGKLEAFEQALASTRQMVETVREEVAHPPKAIHTLPPELQQQLRDQWFQITAQIEASRASMADTIAHQVEMMETRLAGKTATPLSRTASDYATQRQIEQQTQILSELVATLGVLDAHMQQIKTEMHATK